jgi:uncharacterized glyoxalase superfamily protein PhnB
MEFDKPCAAVAKRGVPRPHTPAIERAGAALRDPFGHEWMVATRKEQLSNEELRER